MCACIHSHSVLLNAALLTGRLMSFVISNDQRRGTATHQWRTLFSSAHSCIANCCSGNPCHTTSLPSKEEGIDPIGMCLFTVYQLVSITFSSSNLLCKTGLNTVLRLRSLPGTWETVVCSVEKSFKLQLRPMKTISRHRQSGFLQTQYKSWNL